MSSQMNPTRIAVFKGRQVRKTIHNNEWWFVVEDVVLALIDSHDVKQYIQRMKQRDPELVKGWVQFVRTLLVQTPGGDQKMNCANTEGIFRIIQSIPSPKAEPFKLWLAKVGHERIQEIADPEKSLNRARENWQKHGRSAKWIQQRMLGHPPTLNCFRVQFRRMLPGEAQTQKYLSEDGAGNT